MILEEIYKLSRETGTVNGDISLVIIDELLKKGSFNLTVTELSKKTGCSQPSASRYAKKLGINYYKKMIQIINEEAPTYFFKNSSNKNKETVGLAKAELVNTVSQTLEQIKDEEISYIAQWILKAKKINVVAMGGNIAVKQEIEYKLAQIGKSPLLAVDWHQQMINLNYMGSEDLLILISYSGEKAETINIAQEAHLRKVPVLLFSGTFDAKINQYATYKLPIYSKDAKYRAFSFSSIPAMLALWEVIFREIIRLDDVGQEIIEAWKWKKDNI